MNPDPPVIPAKAGIQNAPHWIPVIPAQAGTQSLSFAGMTDTGFRVRVSPCQPCLNSRRYRS